MIFVMLTAYVLLKFARLTRCFILYRLAIVCQVEARDLGRLVAHTEGGVELGPTSAAHWNGGCLA